MKFVDDDDDDDKPKFCKIDIANIVFLKDDKLLKSTVGVGSLFRILMTRSVKKKTKLGRVHISTSIQNINIFFTQ